MIQDKPEDLAQTIEIYKKDGEWMFRDSDRNLEDVPFTKDGPFYWDSDLHKYEQPHPLTFSRRAIANNHGKFAEKKKTDGGYFFKYQNAHYAPMWFSDEFIALFDKVPLRMFFQFEQIAETIREIESQEIQEDANWESDEFSDEEEASGWSKELIDLSRKILYEVPVDSFSRHYCILKNLDGEFSIIHTVDAANEDYKTRDIHSDEIITQFQSLDELLEAGWVVD